MINSFSVISPQQYMTSDFLRNKLEIHKKFFSDNWSEEFPHWVTLKLHDIIYSPLCNEILEKHFDGNFLLRRQAKNMLHICFKTKNDLNLFLILI